MGNIILKMKSRKGHSRNYNNPEKIRL